MSVGPPLTIKFRDARISRAFTSRYLTEVLRPGVEHPVEGAHLYDANPSFLAAAGAIISLGWAGDQIAAGLYITIDGLDTAWINGVRVREKFRRLGYGSAMVTEALAYISGYLNIRHCALTVFCDGQGIPNEAAFDLYLECGFRQLKWPYPVTVAGSLRDRHLGAAGTKRLAVQMEIGSKTRINRHTQCATKFDRTIHGLTSQQAEVVSDA